jgi:hypothetical protein
MMADLLQKAKKPAKKAPAQKSSKKELRVVDLSTGLQEKVLEICELAHLEQIITPLLKQRKDVLAGDFFDIWTEEMWEKKSQPDNFNTEVRNDKSMVDARCQFQLKFRTNVVKKKLPAELPEDTTTEEFLAKLIARTTGMPDKKARKFVDEEVVVTDKIGLMGTFDEMYYSEEGSPAKKIATLLLTYIQARSRAKDGKVKVVAFDDELAEEALVSYQEVVLKGSLGARVYTYCESLEQLRKLLRFLEVTTQVANFSYGISDEVEDRTERLQDAVSRYIVAE